jgi:hypothetical protein
LSVFFSFSDDLIQGEDEDEHARTHIMTAARPRRRRIHRRARDRDIFRANASRMVGGRGGGIEGERQHASSVVFLKKNFGGGGESRFAPGEDWRDRYRPSGRRAFARPHARADGE